MKIRSVALLNLNSLRGEHHVDFAGGAIGGAGIFAITGPTGAGKTTLLDAITLALYGRAARYGKDPNPADMMSRHTGECRAEVEFDVGGEVYRAVWQLHRARGSAIGKVQPTKRYIYGADGRVLAETLREADAKIEELCGLDYGRFMRSVLLAQGEFARFLKADPDERAALLESLTGTGVYSELSKLAFDEFTRRDRELETHEKELELLKPLPVEEREERERQAAALSEQRRVELAEQGRRRKALAAAEALAAELADEAKLLARQAALAGRREESKELLDALAIHRAAEPLRPAVEQADKTAERARAAKRSADVATREAIATSRIHYQSIVAALNHARQQIIVAERELDSARKSCAAADQRRRDAEKWLQAHRVDAQLADALSGLYESLGDLTNARGNLSDATGALENLRKEQRSAKQRHEAADAALRTAISDKKRAGAATGEKTARFEKLQGGRDLAARRRELERLTELRSHRRECEATKRRGRELAQRVAQDVEKLPGLREAEGAAAAQHAIAEKRVADLQRHLADARLIASFEQHRAELDAGESCPLCGATDHPFCSPEQAEPTPPGNIERDLRQARAAQRRIAASLDERRRAVTRLETQLAEREKAAEELKRRVQAIDRADHDLRHELPAEVESEDLTQLEARWRSEIAALEAGQKEVESATREALLAKGAAEKRAAEATAARDTEGALSERLEKQSLSQQQWRREIETATSRLEQALAPVGLEVPQLGHEAEFRALLGERNAQFAAHSKAKTDALTELKEAQAAETEAARRRADLVEKRAEYAAMIGGEQPAESDAGEVRVSSVEAGDQLVHDSNITANRRSSIAEERGNATLAAEAEAAQAHSALDTALEGSAFADPDALRAAFLDRAAAADATTRERELDEESQQLQGALKACREEIRERRKQKPVEGGALAALSKELERTDKSLEALASHQAEIQAELKRDDATRKRQAAAAEQFATQRKELAVWQLLSALIGSRDGKKFRVFAQGLTLDLLLAHANRHLARLSDRYLLRRGLGGELELEIIDLYQASAVRPMSSLSGGESFLASLALALGLSDLAGRKVQIDSLFIDEGFGSLDSETLDVAISALESLRLQEKTVGIISHVEMLKERIGVQIRVERKADGTSTLQVIEA